MIVKTEEKSICFDSNRILDNLILYPLFSAGVGA